MPWKKPKPWLKAPVESPSTWYQREPPRTSWGRVTLSSAPYGPVTIHKLADNPWWSMSSTHPTIPLCSVAAKISVVHFVTSCWILSVLIPQFCNRRLLLSIWNQKWPNLSKNHHISRAFQNILPSVVRYNYEFLPLHFLSILPYITSILLSL